MAWTKEDMEHDYPYFRRFVYDKLREEFEQTAPPFPEDEAGWLAEIENAQPIDDLLAELEREDRP
jgi:hypothetical protein